MNEKIDALVKKMRSIEDDPKNQNPKGSLFLYTKLARIRLAKIADEIAFEIGKEREEKGIPVNSAGYSGRKSNR